MKVVVINTVASSHNAPGRIMTQISKAAINQGNDVLAVYGRGAVPEGISGYRIGSGFDVMRHVVMSRLTDSAGLHSNSVTKALTAKLESYKPDVVHLHNIHGYYVNYQILMQWLKRSNVPVVWTLHDCWAYTGHCAYYAKNDCDKWKTDCNNCRFKHQYPKSIWQSKSERNYSLKKEIFTSLPNLTIVTPSQWLADEVAQSFLGKYQIEVIPNGIDTTIFKPLTRLHNERCLVLGVAANWEERKNFEFFLRLAHAMPDIDIMIVGETSRKIKMQCPKNIILKGLITDNNKLAQLYSSADLFINPSREETFGMTTVEAMSCLTPVITNNATAISEPVANMTGVSLDINNTQAVINAINHILRHRKEYSSSCRQHVIEKYSISAMTDRYIDLYKRLTNA